MRMGATMATCNTTGGGTSGSYNNDGGAALGQGLVDMIHGFKERSFRNKIGKMLAAGDCEGAVRYAYQKGRIELGASLQQTCAANRAQADAPQSSVEDGLAKIASGAKTPIQLKPDLSLTQVQARGNRLSLTLVVLSKGGSLATLAGERIAIKQASCSSDDTRPLLAAGATIQADYFNFDGKLVASDIMASGTCAGN
jgi:hypothetical protein